MQSKPIAVLVVPSLVVASLLVAGCTVTNTSNPSPSATPAPTYSPTSSSNADVVSPTEFANKITQYIKDEYGSEITVVTPFVYKGTVSGHQTYTGVIKDGSKKLKVWNRTITYTLCDSRSAAKTVYSQAQNKATSQGYGSPSVADPYWIAYYGGEWQDKVGSKEVVISICEPDGLCGADYYMIFAQYFAVTTEYKTRLE